MRGGTSKGVFLLRNNLPSIGTKATMSRSARRLKEGWVLIPDPL